MKVAVGTLHVCDVTPSENTVAVDLLLITVLLKCILLDLHIVLLAPLYPKKSKH